MDSPNKCYSISPEGNFTLKETRAIADARYAYYDRLTPTILMMALFCIIGIPGNLMVVIVYLREKRLTTTRFLMFVLATLDSFICLLVIPENIAFHLYWLDIQSVFICKLYWGVNYATVTPGLFLAAGVTIVRYCHVCKPTELYRVERMVKPYLIISFSICFLTCILTAYCSGCTKWIGIDRYTPGFHCAPSDECRKTIYFIIIYFVTSVTFLYGLLTIFVLNSLIFKRLYLHQRVMDSYKMSKRARQAAQKSRRSGSTRKTDSQKFSFTDGFSTSMTPSTVRSECRSTRVSDRETSVIANSYIGSVKSIDRTQPNENIKNHGTEIDKNKWKTQTPLLNDQNKSPKTNKESNVDKESCKINARKKKTNRKKRKKYKKNKPKLQANSTGALGEHLEQRETHGYENGKKMRKTKYNKPHRYIKNVESAFIFQTWNRTTLKLFIVTLVYFITYTPAAFAVIYLNTGPTKVRNEEYNMFKFVYNPSIFITFLSSAVNPIIYAFVDPQFRNQCRTLFVNTFALF